MQFRIDPEFCDKIPPISPDEFHQLRENILAAGEIFEPLVVWNGVLVDGHNRWKVIQEHPEIKWRTRTMEFPDKWAAFEWMYKNQLGRRNLTDEQRKYTIGKMYEARKKSVGEHKGNQYVKMEAGQNDQIPTRRETKDGTAGQIGKEVGMGEKNVRRAEKFAQGVDALKQVSPEAADKVLSGRAVTTDTDIRKLGAAEQNEVVAAADAILHDIAFGKRKEAQETEAAQEPYNLSDLIDEIAVNGNSFVRTLRKHIKTRIDVVGTNGAGAQIAEAINEIIYNLQTIKEEFE